jgi:hypothetical protein
VKSNWETGGMLEDDARAAKDSFLIPASLLLSMAVFTAYAFAVKALFFTGASAEAAKAAALFIPELRKHLQPEPLERHLYLVGLLCIAALPILFYVLLTRLEERSCGGTGWWKHPTVCMTRDMVLGAGLLLWLFTLSGHLHIPLLGQYFLAACILALAIPRLIRIRAPSWPWPDADRGQA